MERTVAAHIDLELSGQTELVFSIAVSRSAYRAAESISFLHNGVEQRFEEIGDLVGTRLHRLHCGPGKLVVDYSATVTGRALPAPVEITDTVTFLRPSRYAESDSLFPTARSEFQGLEGIQLLDAVRDWVASRLYYVPGSSLPTDGAERTLLARQGVCRDYAHLVTALLRALDVPARLVSVYAPGLSPMDFHAVVEAHVDGQWYTLDATGLAPRQSLLRIATGRDAADTAWLTSHGPDIRLNELSVLAIVDELPLDDHIAKQQLG
jgi:transglutaminase-like putative cysteine protease